MIFLKLPNNDTIFTTDENPQRHFISFFSFDQNQKLDFAGNLIEISREKIQNQPLFSNRLHSLVEPKDISKKEYLKKIEEAIEFIHQNHVKKLVISRVKTVDFERVNLSETFLQLCDHYPGAMVYFFVNEDSCWMGAFGELLGKFHKKTSLFETMSVAGTLPLNETWTAKEIDEQKTVTDFIRENLQHYSIENLLTESEPQDLISGDIKHLYTHFSTKINESTLEDLIQTLHPTPAVCGIPKAICLEGIKKLESHQRQFYSGYTKIETQDTIYYYVNLRCGKFYKNSAELFVGGGITAQSHPEKEWQETELKARAIAQNLVL